jgi:hypothetical protein
MVACSACVEVATINVHGYDLCPVHGRGMMTAVLCGDKTPVGYIIDAACGVPDPVYAKVSAQKHDEHVSSFMRHGALPALPQPRGASMISDCPQPLRAVNWTEHRTVKVSNQKWRERI